MIAPGILATAAHLCHVDNDPTQSRHERFEAIRSPDIGQTMESAIFVAEDPKRDLALLQISSPRSNACVTLEPNQIPTGTLCGSLGFPLGSVSFSKAGRMFDLLERFQSGSISAYACTTHTGGRQLWHYETDSFMYAGSSGCPGFVNDARVFAMNVSSITERDTAPNFQARVAIAIWIPAIDIRDFARANSVVL